MPPDNSCVPPRMRSIIASGEPKRYNMAYKPGCRPAVERESIMRFSSARRFGLFALLALTFVAIAQPSYAQGGTGTVRMKFVKGGWFIGGQAGNGTLTFGGRTYQFGIGGVSAGLT